MPATWQGWATVLSFLVLLIGGASIVERSEGTNNEGRDAVIFLAAVIVGAILLFGISWLKGPRPKWRWGQRPNDNPDEDY